MNNEHVKKHNVYNIIMEVINKIKPYKIKVVHKTYDVTTRYRCRPIMN